MKAANRVSLRQPLVLALGRLSRLALRCTDASAAGFFVCDDERGPRWAATAGSVNEPDDEAELCALCREVLRTGQPKQLTDACGRRLAAQAVCRSDEGCVAVSFIRKDSPEALSSAQLECLDDIVSSATSELNLLLSSSRLAVLIDHMNAGVLFEGADRRGQLVNREFCSLFGVLPTDALGLFGGGLLAKARGFFQSPSDFVRSTNRALRVGSPEQGQRFKTRDGRWLERDYVPVTLPHGNDGHLWLFRDVTQDLEAEAGLVERNTWLKLLHAIAEMAASTTDEHTTLERAALLICEHAGWLEAGVQRPDGSDPLLARAVESGEVCWRYARKRLSRSGRAEQERTHIACPIKLGGQVAEILRFELAGHVAPSTATLEALAIAANTLTQSVARLRREQEIREQSLIDPLTSLYNRRGFMLLGQQQLKLAARQEATLVVFFMDLNGLKRINDELGHEVGDQAICDAASILRASFRSTDIVARLAGDEYCVLSVDLGVQDVPIVLKRLNSQMEDFNQRAARNYGLSISVGYALFDPNTPQGIHELLRTADQDMYRNKQAHKRHLRAAVLDTGKVGARAS
ncbi:MAG: diguanylate cyclase [Myxococcales bacterium]|nr:diguanylate cyclase [Myxococcales bacterium]